MARKDWDYVGIPKIMTKRLDAYLKTERANKMGMTSRQELLRKIISEYLDRQESL